MNEVLGYDEIGKLLGSYAAIEKRLAELLLEIKPQKPGLFAFLKCLLSSKYPYIGQSEPIWRQETEDIVRALAVNDRQELASLMNLHALNAAIEATRYQDSTLVRHAEVLRRYSEQVRNFTVKQ
ncbi:hypothetical protein [Hymenobacter terrestris]|uniref:Uncharacterized protein n=1 Tax=Hymenobacter terrestris TaxID=2748310 RepID=A0ABX2Q3F6_9BACT|nr:hypothetical protein [Hymenobacter terrestris]NVO85363.1 hypothetical protein [Hymenobacter terrestris]